MEILSNAPVRTASLLWQPQAGAYALTILCKATFRLLPGTAELASEQENPNEEENYWNDDPTRSLYAPSDFVPYKPRADVLLVGHAFAPRGEPVRSLMVRMVIGSVDKSIEVHGERTWGTDGVLREGARFSRMPLRYERAAGGPETSNPVGMRIYGAEGYGTLALPNLQPPGMHVSQRGEWIPPVCFGPIAPTWPSRMEKLSPMHANWARAPRFDVPLPDGLDPRFFNAAPDDQQTSAIRPNERIVLDNLHPEHPRLATSLPGLTLRAVAERNGSNEEISLDCDTLWIDTDRGLCTVVWRGRLSLSHPAERGRIVITTADASQPVRPSPAQRTAPPASNPNEESEEDFTQQIPASALGDALPFVRKEKSPGPAPASAPGRVVPPSPQTPAPPFARPSVPSAMPFKSPTAGAPPMAPPPITPGPLPVAPAPPQPPMAPTPPPPASPPAPLSPWALGASPSKPDSPPRPPMQSAAFAPPPNEAAPAPRPSGSGSYFSPRFEPAPPAAVTPKPPSVAADAARLGVAGASTAAASADRADRIEKQERAPEPTPARAAPTPSAAPSREAMTLLWLEEPKADAIVRCQQWTKLLSEAEQPDEPEPEKDEEDEEEDYFAEPEEEEEEESEAEKQRKRVAKILSRGEPSDGPGLALAVVNAVTKNGTLEPPIMLVAGELSFPFEPWETVKALVIAAMPSAVSDKKLKDMLDSVQETSKMPGIERSVSIAEGLATRVREAFVQSNRNLGPGWLDAQAERMLLEGRCYQKRSVLGQTFLRCLLHAPGAEEGIPTYVPEALSKTIPLVSRMRARVIGEVHAPQDQYETYPRALRVLALARMVDLGGTRAK